MYCNKKLANQHLKALIQQASKHTSQYGLGLKKIKRIKENENLRKIHKPSILCFSNGARERGGGGGEKEKRTTL